MKRRIVLISASIAVIIVVVLMAVHAAFAQSSTGSSLTTIPNKAQALAARATAQAQFDASSPHAPKPAIPPTMISSCPQTPFVGIVPAHMEADDLMHTYHFINAAGLRTSSGMYYGVVAGSLLNNANQGILLVQQENLDPCMHPVSYTMLPYLTPSQQGTLQLTAISGDTVQFVTSTGVKGSFNVLTGQFGL